MAASSQCVNAGSRRRSRLMIATIAQKSAESTDRAMSALPKPWLLKLAKVARSSVRRPNRYSTWTELSKTPVGLGSIMTDRPRRPCRRALFKQNCHSRPQFHRSLEPAAPILVALNSRRVLVALRGERSVSTMAGFRDWPLPSRQGRQGARATSRARSARGRPRNRGDELSIAAARDSSAQGLLRSRLRPRSIVGSAVPLRRHLLRGSADRPTRRLQPSTRE